MAPAPRLTFKGPAHSKRARKPPVVLDPIVPRAPSRATRNRRVSDVGESRPQEEEQLNAPVQRTKDKAGIAKVQTVKAPTNRRRQEVADSVEEAADAASDASGDAIDTSHVPYETHVPRDVVAKRWQPLSASARSDLRSLVDRASRDAMEEAFPDTSSSRTAQAARATLEVFADEFASALAALSVPPLSAALAGPCRTKDAPKEVSLSKVLAGEDLRAKNRDLKSALEAEEQECEALQARVDKQRRLLKRDRARLAER
ncbi:hypothetical protein DMC30DRAFT_219150 [Rhodotorula diobovata]|uniref:Uncharacterized protein n=1 Tax=Rhodotorula diobovata TaxID=5288 RepID=A0A5C5FWE1_9BASI|nr:hypothetical protein DMC30DRAFT_219150 [Rhodotorula diobovata]